MDTNPIQSVDPMVVPPQAYIESVSTEQNDYGRHSKSMLIQRGPVTRKEKTEGKKLLQKRREEN